MAASVARIASLRLSTSKFLCRAAPVCYNSQAGYAVKKIKPKKGAAAIGTQVKHYQDIESDPVKLTTTLCGGNIYKEGTDPVLKPDSEYPDWLWTLKTNREAVPLEELDPDTKHYWMRVRKEDKLKQNRLAKTRAKWSRY